jgi:hypothetical protein
VRLTPFPFIFFSLYFICEGAVNVLVGAKAKIISAQGDFGLYSFPAYVDAVDS